MAEITGALSYHEPNIVTILILSSFLLLLNVITHVLDRIVYCGLVGQILVGIAYGVPGAHWLSAPAQDFIMQFGYLGLILIVYEGGLSTNLHALKANLALSSLVALIGIGMPIALSFVLQGLLDITPLQAFAAGAALCSTSLGTTFTVLSTSGLTESRLGIVLTSAAMMDDVVGLVMVQVIANLGGRSGFEVSTVLRPVGVSLAFAGVLPLACAYLVKPVALWAVKRGVRHGSRISALLVATRAKFVAQTLVLLGIVTGAVYAGASALFAAYLAGVCIVWWDGLDLAKASESKSPAAEPQSTSFLIHEKPQDDSSTAEPSNAISSKAETPLSQTHLPGPLPQSASTKAPAKGLAIYEQYYGKPVESILKPFFFASIGFSIPITKMFAGGIVWRGLIYAALMIFAKLVCGACLLRFNLPPLQWTKRIRMVQTRIKTCWPSAIPASQPSSSTARSSSSRDITPPRTTPNPPRTKNPLSLYPSAILGGAMVARGEIGFLISSVAQSNGIFAMSDATGGESSSELFLVVTWAILICTILGPVAVGTLVRRVKRLQDAERQSRTGKEDPLGIWGITSGNGGVAG